VHVAKKGWRKTSQVEHGVAPMSETVESGSRNAHVAAIIVAANAQRRVAASVRAALAMPAVDLVIVVDDGSQDNTREAAQEAGALVVRHSHQRGRATCIETGVAVAGMRDEPGHDPRHLLILDAPLGEQTVGAASLVPPVVEGVTDLAIASVTSVPGFRARGMAASLARNAVERVSGWSPDQPLSRIRCVTRPALEVALPLARGAGLDIGMTLDVLLAGLSVTEVVCEIDMKERQRGLFSSAVRSSRYRDVMLAVNSRRLRGGFEATQQAVGDRIRGSRRRGDKS